MKKSEEWRGGTETDHELMPTAGLLAERVSTILQYYRSYARRPADCVAPFFHALRTDYQRFRRLGAKRWGRMAALELACAEAGLSFPGFGVGRATPWTLPDNIFECPPEALPDHPLVDVLQLGSLSREVRGGQASALVALEWLLDPASKAVRFANLRLLSSEAGHPRARIAVCLHLYYPTLWPEIATSLDSITEPWDLYVTVPDFACTNVLQTIQAAFPCAAFLPCPNRGRDVLPFLTLLRTGILDDYDAVCKLHTKRSPHSSSGDDWRRSVLDELVGSKQVVANVIARFRSEPPLGLVGPAGSIVRLGERRYFGGNRRQLASLSGRRSGMTILPNRSFFAGTMFWCRPAALSRVRELRVRQEDFPLEMGQVDGTLAHALERLIVWAVSASGFRVLSARADASIMEESL